MCVSPSSISQSYLTLHDPVDSSPSGSSVHRILQARILEKGRYSLLQRIFLIQGSNLCLQHCRQILYHLTYQGRPDHHVGLQKIKQAEITLASGDKYACGFCNYTWKDKSLHYMKSSLLSIDCVQQGMLLFSSSVMASSVTRWDMQQLYWLRFHWASSFPQAF